MYLRIEWVQNIIPFLFVFLPNKDKDSVVVCVSNVSHIPPQASCSSREYRLPRYMLIS